MVRRSLEKISCGIFFFPFVILRVFFFSRKTKRGGGYVFNYFAYIVTLLRLWGYLGFF